MLGERPSPLQLGGSLIVLGAVYVATLAEGAQKTDRAQAIAGRPMG